MSSRTYRLLIQPMGGVSLHDLVWLAQKLSKVYLNVKVIVSQTYLQPSLEWYNWHRMQYRSESILYYADELRRKLRVEYLLVVANLDAYANGLNFVFGEALLGRGTAIVYTRRLDPVFYGQPPNNKLFLERLLKESMHELGHAMGLDHCGNPRCVMSFSNSVLEVDAKMPAYCTRCALRLQSKGVAVNTSYVIT